jgi:hypothetical protein
LSKDRIEIKKMGSFLELDDEGFVKSIDTKAPLQESWSDVVDRVIEFYKKEVGPELHSVYIRGSAAKAEAVDFVSDLDSFAVSRIEVGDEPRAMDEFEKGIKKDFPFCNHVEISVVSLDQVSEVPPKRKRSIWEELIKTQSRCVFGEDLSSAIAPFLLEDMLGHSLYLDDEVKNKLPSYMKEDKDDPIELKSNCVWIMRRILRGAFDLVMVKEAKFTRDLYLCYEVVSKVYPEKESSLRQALSLSLNPSSNPKEWMPLVLELNDWINTQLAN